MWIAEVSRDRSMPIDQVHVAAYGYFPQVGPDGPRPFLWRLVAPDRILLVSHLRPSAPSAREVSVAPGVTLDFRLTWRRNRNSGGPTARKDGTHRARRHSVIEIKDHDELKARLIRFAGERGGDVRYVRIEGLRYLRPGKHGVVLPICDAIGKIFVRDADAFGSLLCNGGPGTGKAYGLGLWYLPEVMGIQHAAA